MCLFIRDGVSIRHDLQKSLFAILARDSTDPEPKRRGFFARFSNEDETRYSHPRKYAWDNYGVYTRGRREFNSSCQLCNAASYKKLCPPRPSTTQFPIYYFYINEFEQSRPKRARVHRDKKSKEEKIFIRWRVLCSNIFTCNNMKYFFTLITEICNRHVILIFQQSLNQRICYIAAWFNCMM